MTSGTVCTSPSPEIQRFRPNWLTELPEPPRRFLAQVYTALEAGILDLGVIGIRTVVDLVAVRLVGDLGAFPQKLDGLVREGYISDEDRQCLAVVIDAGSAVAHRGHSFGLGDIHLMLDCIEPLLFAHFIRPRRLKRLARSIPKRGHGARRRPGSPPRPAGPRS